MKSFCIKTNNSQVIDYLLKSLDSIPLENIYYINKKFKIYQNVIIHYKGNDLGSFYSIISDIISNCIILYYEPYLLKNIINFNYFYFENLEKKKIEENCYEYICSDENERLKFRKEEIWTQILKYIMENKSIVLDGVVNFRLGDYIKSLEYVVDYGVNKFVIDKEYSEFINLLQIYIESKESEKKLLHLVYTNGESILLDENKNIVSLTDHIFDSKYLSDISFSSNDYALNTLLTLLPERIEIHLIGYEDDFINTLKLIFGKRVFVCKDCNICRTYKILNNVKY